MDKKTLSYLVIVFISFFLINSCNVEKKKSIKVKEIEISDSIRNGIIKTYYESGEIQYEEQFKDDIPIYNHYRYDRAGNLLHNYLFDHNGNLRFKYTWNPAENRFVKEGKIIFVQGTFKNEYLVGDTISIIPVIANPFKEDIDISFKLGDEIIEKTFRKNASQPMLLYEVEKGDNKIEIISRIYDSSAVMIQSDTVKFSMEGETKKMGIE